MKTIHNLLLILIISILANSGYALNPKIDSAQWNDNNLDGYIDQVLLYFDSLVTITDAEGSADGLNCIIIRDGATAVTVDPADYTIGTDTNKLALDFRNDSIYGTGIFGLSVTYTRDGTSEILNGSDEINNGSNPGKYVDNAQPVVMEAYFRDGHPDEGDGSVVNPDGQVDNILMVFSEELATGATGDHSDIASTTGGNIELTASSASGERWSLSSNLTDNSRLRWNLEANCTHPANLSSASVPDFTYQDNDNIYDVAGNRWAEGSTAVVQLIDGAAPFIDAVTFTPGDGNTEGIDSTILVDVLVSGIDSTILSAGTFLVNSNDVTPSFTSTSGGYYQASYVVSESATDIDDASEALPIDIVLTDTSGNSNTSYTSSTIAGTPGVDASRPVIDTVSIPNQKMKINSVVTASISVTNTGGDLTGLKSGKIAGFPLSNLTKIGAGAYEAEFTVTDNGTYYPGNSDIPVSNMVVIDNAGNLSTQYTGVISQSSDTLDADAPSISSVTIPNDTMKVGDVVTATISVDSDGGDFPALISGDIGGYNLTNLTRVNQTTYTANFTINESGNSYAAGDDISVNNLVLEDEAGNQNTPVYTQTISQANDLVDANTPAVSGVTIPDESMKIGDSVLVTITPASYESNLLLISGEIGGYVVDTSTFTAVNPHYTAKFEVAEGGNDYTDSDKIPVDNLVISDEAGNTSTAYNDSIDNPNDTLDANRPVIAGVSLPNDTMKVGDIVTVTIYVEPDNGDFPEQLNGTVAGYNLQNLARINATTYTATFEIIDGGTDIPAGNTIPVRNVQLTDEVGNVSALHDEDISQANDLLDANKPGIQDFKPQDGKFIIGDTQVDTIVVADDQGDIPVLVGGSYGGYTLSNLTRLNSTTYTVELIVTEGGNTYYADEDIELTGLRLKDEAGNYSNTYTETVSRGTDPIFAERPGATLSGSTTICADDSALVTIDFTGVSPWDFTLSEGGDDQNLVANSTPYTFYTDSAGTYSITALTDSTGNSPSSYASSVTINVDTLPVVSFAMDETYNVNDPAVTLTGNPAGGTFSGPGITVSDSRFHPDLAGVGDHIINYVYTDGNGCSADHDESVSVVDADAFYEGLETYYCYGSVKDTVYVRNVPDTATSLSLTIAGGSGLTLIDDTTGVIDPTAIGYGTDTLKFEYFDGAWFNINRSFTVDSVGTDIDFVTLNSSYCTDAPNVSLNAINLFPSGGTGNFSGPTAPIFEIGPGSNAAIFRPSAEKTDSTYTISYFYTAPNSGCTSDTIVKNVTVNTLPEVSFTLKSNYNVDGPDINLTSNHDTLGTFNGPGVINNKLVPAEVGVRSGVVIDYVYTDTLTGCSNETSDTTDIREATVNIQGLADSYCFESAAYGVTVSDKSYTEGRFYGRGIDSVDVDTATFTPAIAGRGHDTIVYQYYDDSTLYETSKVVFVDSVGQVSFVGLNSEYCAGSPLITLTPDKDHVNGSGVFSFSNDTTPDFNNEGSSATLIPSHELADSLPYQVIYTYTSNLSGCSDADTQQVYIHPLPEVDFTLASNYNVDGDPVPLSGNHYPSGVFSGGGVLDNILYPDLVGFKENHEITYSFTDTITGCTNQKTDSTNIYEADVNILGLSSTYCYDSTEYLVTVADHSYSEGRFFGKGIDSVGVDSAVFVPAIAGNGYDTIVYKYFRDSTAYQVSQVVRVDSIGPPKILNLASEYCASTTQFTINGSLNHPDGSGSFTFSKDAGDAFIDQGNSALFTPVDTLASAAPYTVTYTYTSDISGCQRSVSKETTVHPLPDVSFDLLNNYNVSVEQVDLNGVPAGGDFSGPGVFQDTLNNYYFSPQQAKAGENYKITYVYTDINGCQNDTIKTTNVRTVDAQFYDIPSGNYYCIDGVVDTIYARAFNSNGDPGVISGPGITDLGNDTALFYPAIAGEGEHIVTYEYIGDDNTTQFEISESLVVDSIGEVRIVGLDSAYCEDASQITIEPLVNHPDGSGNFYGPASGFINASSEAYINPSEVGPNAAPYTVEYVYTSYTGCTSSVKREFYINALPELAFTIKDLYNTEDVPDTIQGSPSGGYFTGKGIVNDSIFRPDIAGVGNWNLTYLFTDTNGCANTKAIETEVQESSGYIDYNETDNIYCYTSPIDTLIAYPGNSSGQEGWFEGAGLTKIGRDSVIFDPQLAGDGTHPISYKYYGFDSTTVFSLDLSLIVDSIGTVDFSGLGPEYCEDYSQVTLTPQIPSGGTGSFTTQTGLYNAGDVGYLNPDEMIPDSTYQIEYIFTSSLSGCKKTVVKEVHINPLPVVSFEVLDVYNLDSDPVLFTGDPAGSTGLFQPLSIMSNNGDGTAFFNPSAAGVGNHNITYTYTDANSCENSVVKQIEVQESTGELTVNDADNIYCYDASNDTVYANPVNSDGTYGTFSGPGITDLGNNKAVFNPSDAGDGEHQVTFEYKGEGGVTNFYLTKKLIVDSLGKVDFIGLSPHFCKNDPQVELTPITSQGEGTETFFGNGVLGDFYIPGNAPVGYDTVSYVFTSSYSQCQVRKDSVIEIHALPEIGFEITDECISEEGDSTGFVNNTTSLDPVAQWDWDFGDIASGEENTSSERNPKHYYSTPGEKTVTLTATTNFGCAVEYDSTINLGTTSHAEFTWMSECYGDDPIQFVADDDNGNITEYTWNFGDGTNGVNSTSKEVDHLFPLPANYQVKLSVYSKFGCEDSVVKTVPVRPYVYFDQLQNNIYVQDFESGGNGWVSEAEVKGGINTWELGAPEGNIIDHAPDSSGSAIWYTDVNYPNHQPEKSYVTSPCFDFSSLDRPMIKMDIWTASDQYRDGANIQYTTDGGNTWTNIGTTDDGIEWYNYTRIAGEPGGEREGWSKSVPDTSWSEARNNLDIIAGQNNIQFRIAYGSDGNEVDEFEGFAFDNIWIGNRTRRAVIEHFTNTEDQTAKASDNNYVNPLVHDNSEDVIDLQYHTSYPEPDALNEDYPAGPGARSAYYGVSEVPHTILDGNYRSYDYLEGNTLSENDLRERILMDPYFEVEPVIEQVDSFIKTETKLTALRDFKDLDLGVYTYILEKNISADNWGGLATEKYRNIVKAILPDPGGHRLLGEWTVNESESVKNVWRINNVYNVDSLMVLSFVQNTKTKEIYQAAIASVGSVDTTITTGIEQPGNQLPGFTIFPNPAMSHLNILFDKKLDNEAEVLIYSNLGELVFRERIHAHIQQKQLNLTGLVSGMYHMKVVSGNKVIGVEKVFLAGD